MTTYRETLRPPFSWWLIAALFAASVGWVFLVVSNWTVGIAAGVITAIPLGYALWKYALRVEVTDGDLIVGRARLGSSFQGDACALDAAAFRHTMGPGADARTFLRTRPYAKTGVLVAVDDPQDPTPYWLVSTRRPDALVASLGHTGKDHREPIGEKTVVEED